MKELINILSPVSCTICILGSLLLFLRPNNNRSGRVLALIMLVVGIFYMMQIATLNLGFPLFVNRSFFAPVTLIVGNFFVIVVMQYVIELLRPGWLNMRRFFLVLLPYLSVVAIYFLVIRILGEHIRVLSDSSELAIYGREFNVWYRSIILFSLVLYLLFFHGMILHFHKSYKQWCADNYSSTERMDVSWVKYFFAGTVALTIAFSMLIFIGRPINFVIHHLVMEILLVYLLYKALFHINPYPEGYFKQSINKTEDRLPEPEEDVFGERIGTYKQLVEKWMIDCRPYLRPDLKLMDVAEILPLNRSYLSRVFNEGFGASFSRVIREYRLNEAQRLLKERPDLTVNEIVYQCGFVSAPSFHHAFMNNFGITPRQYRNSIKS